MGIRLNHLGAVDHRLVHRVVDGDAARPCATVDRCRRSARRDGARVGRRVSLSLPADPSGVMGQSCTAEKYSNRETRVRPERTSPGPHDQHMKFHRTLLRTVHTEAITARLRRRRVVTRHCELLVCQLGNR